MMKMCAEWDDDSHQKGYVDLEKGKFSQAHQVKHPQAEFTPRHIHRHTRRAEIIGKKVIGEGKSFVKKKAEFFLIWGFPLYARY